MQNIFYSVLLFSFSFNPIFVYSQNIFDVNSVHKIEIFFNEPNWKDSLNLYFTNGNGERLIADSILINGLRDEDVGVKFKGGDYYNASSNKNPFNIKLDYINNGQSINGYNVLKLSNGYTDPTFVREVLAYEIAREYMPASKAVYGNVYVDNVYIGIYTIVQAVDDDFTNEHFYERKGPFFKAEETQIQPPGCSSATLGIWDYLSDTTCYQRAYDMISVNDWEKLHNFMDTVNNHFIHIENVLNIDRTLWMMAFTNLIVSLDAPINTMPNNFYLFKDNNNRFNPIIWNNNEAFGTYTSGLPSPVTNSSLQFLDPFHGASNPLNQMNANIFSDNRYKRMYVAHMRTIINEFFANNSYLNRALALQQLIDPFVATDPNFFFQYNEFISNINSTASSTIGLTELMDARLNYLQSLPEFSANPPSISTVNPTQIAPHSTVNLTAIINNADYAYLGYRFKFSENFNKIEMYDDGLHNDGLAGDGVFGVSFDVDARDVQYYIYADNMNSGIFYPERAEKEFLQIPVTGGLVINEIMAANLTSNADQSGEYDDWVELYNSNPFSVNLNGYYLSDNENDLQKWTFPNVTIPANDYLIIWCDTAGNTQPGLHTTYRLLAEQEEVYLTDPSGSVIDAVHFVNMPVDLAYARVPNGSGTFVYQDETHDNHNTPFNSNTMIINNDQLSVVPNPATSTITISTAGNEKIMVFDIIGKEIGKYEPNSTLFISVNNWKKGVYVVKSGAYSKKIVIK